jgi:tRNA(Phe) wybutosine-synthesizing methylase Tyw3
MKAAKLKMDDKELYVPDDVLERVTKCCLKIKITLSERIGKIYERMKTSERKTVSESEVNEKKTFTGW